MKDSVVGGQSFKMVQEVGRATKWCRSWAELLYKMVQELGRRWEEIQMVQEVGRAER